VDVQRAAQVQAVLQGAPLPATKSKLIAYARREDDSVARDLTQIPDREYGSLDEVGEALVPVQPNRQRPDAEVPTEESDAPPGGDAYLDANAEPGAVRPDAPPENPPEKILQIQTETQKRQQERQQQLG
jgi:hypothetical protein